MRYLSVAAFGAALAMSGGVVYPVHGYRHQGDGSAYRDYDRRADQGDRYRQYDRARDSDGYWRYDRGARPGY
jgi:hypothetical protein